MNLPTGKKQPAPYKSPPVKWRCSHEHWTWAHYQTCSMCGERKPLEPSAWWRVLTMEKIDGLRD